MTRYFLALLGLLSLVPSSVAASQYEATLLEERSLRYENGFGLLQDDFDAFYSARLLPDLGGRRFLTHYAGLYGDGSVLLGYGSGATDALSWSLLAGGMASSSADLTARNDIQSLDGNAGLIRRSLGSLDVGSIPADSADARASLGLGRRLGRTMLGLSLSAVWRSEGADRVANPPSLFSFEAPRGVPEQETRRIDAIDGNAQLSQAERLVDPRTETERLRLGATLSYGSVAPEDGWGWSLDLLGGWESLSDERTVSARTAGAENGMSLIETYESDARVEGSSPFAGAALTFVRNAGSPYWIDIGGEAVFGAPVDGRYGETRGRTVTAIEAGGLSRAFERTETRLDSQSATLGRRYRGTAGFRRFHAVDPLFDFGWAVRANWFSAGDEARYVSAFRVEESFDEDGDGRVGGDEMRSLAIGQSESSYTLDYREWSIDVPLVFVLRDRVDSPLEWRLGSQFRYVNASLDEAQRLDRLTVPSGSRFEGDAATPIRYADMTLPAGAARLADRSELSVDLRAGVGYWITGAVKVDLLFSFVPEPGRFVDLESPDFGLTALVAF